MGRRCYTGVMSGPATRSAVVGAVVLVAGLAVWVLAPSEEGRVRRQLDALAESASVEPGESALIRAARAARVGSYFTDQVRLDLGEPYRPVAGRDALTGLAAAIRLPTGGIRVEIARADVTLDETGSRATVEMTAEVESSSSGGGERMLDGRDFLVRFVKVDGEWLIEELRAIQVVG